MTTSNAITNLEQQRQSVLYQIEVVDREAISLQEQIDRSKSERRNGDWLYRANTRLKHRRRERQRLQILLGEVNRDLKTAHSKVSDREQMFIEVAKERLPKELFLDIVQESNRRRSAMIAAG